MYIVQRALPTSIWTGNNNKTQTSCSLRQSIISRFILTKCSSTFPRFIFNYFLFLLLLSCVKISIFQLHNFNTSAQNECKRNQLTNAMFIKSSKSSHVMHACQSNNKAWNPFKSNCVLSFLQGQSFFQCVRICSPWFRKRKKYVKTHSYCIHKIYECSGTYHDILVVACSLSMLTSAWYSR